MEVVEAEFPRGRCSVQVFTGDLARPSAVVILFMDAFGPRPVLSTLAQRIAAKGYRVLLPELFYHLQPFAPLNPATTFSVPEERARLMSFFGSIDQSSIDADVAALLALANEQEPGSDVGCVGYCMGGRYALTAASAPAVAFAASIHGSNLAPPQSDSPHLRLQGSKARVYIGVAEHDPTFNGEEEGRLAAALREAGLDHMIEIYAGAAHGFAMPDLPVFNAAAAERHWERISRDLSKNLRVA